MSVYNVLETQFLLVPVGYNFITNQCKISITKTKQFKTLLSALPGPFYEGQQGSFCIDRIWVFPPPPHRRLCSMQDVTQYHHRFGNISLVFPNIKHSYKHNQNILDLLNFYLLLNIYS